jgi:hypothetical protein
MSDLVESSPGFFWLHIKKCGGQSFRATFSPPYTEIDRTAPPKSFAELRREEWNDAVNNYRYDLGEYDYKRMLFVRDRLYRGRAFDSMYKFAIVRNPYDRMLSAWRFLYRKRYFQPLRYSFSRFLHSLPEIWATKSDRHVATHTAPIWSDITDEKGVPLLDDVFRLEQIEDAVPILNQRLGTEIRTFGQENRYGSGESYRKDYTSETRSLVEKLFAGDLEHFGYDF